MNNVVEKPYVVERPVSPDVHIKEIWAACYRDKWKILLLTISAVMIVTLVVFSLRPIYRASATLLVEQKLAKPVSIEQVYGIEGSGSEYLYTQFELLKSRSLMESVVRDLGLNDHPDFNPENNEGLFDRAVGWFAGVSVKYNLPFVSPEDLNESQGISESEKLAQAVNAFSEVVQIEPIRGTQLVRVHVEMTDPQLAARAADAVVNAYIEGQLDAKLNMTQTATAWLNERMGGLKENLQESERRLQEYLEKENLVDVKGITTVTADELSQTGRRLSDTRKEREIAESQYRQVQALRGSHWERIATLSFVMDDALVRQFKSAVAVARAKVEELSLRYGPMHPKMRAAHSELNTAQASLREQVERVVAGIEKNYHGAVSKERSLQRSYDENREEIQDITRKEFKLRELQLEVETNRSLYDTFMTRFKETTATSDFEATNARLVDQAVVPVTAVKPKKKLLILLSGMAAFVMGVGLTVFSEILSSSYRTPEELEVAIRVPVIGALPDTGRARARTITHLYTNGKNQLFSESIRSIRTGMLLSKKPESTHVVMITSSVPAEGKTTVSSNLAQSFGTMGPTILVGADLRRPNIGQQFGFSRGVPGLAQILDGSAELKDCIQSKDGITILPAGKIPSNPLELLASNQFPKLIESLAKSYQHVIIDTPPVLAVSDALVVSKLADEVVYVVRAEQTSGNLIKSGLQKLHMAGATLSGIILNRMDMDAKRHHYRYYA